MENTFTNRVLDVIQALKSKNIVPSDRKFAQRIDIDQTQISLARAGKRPIPDKYLYKIVEEFDISKDYLLKGIGEMFSKDNTQLGENTVKTTPRLEAEPLYIAADPNDYNNDGSKFEDLGNGMLRFRFPVVPVKAQAGYLRGYQDPEYYDGFKTEYLEVYKEYHGHYLAFEVRGDSMISYDPKDINDNILPGWIAVGRELLRHHWQYKLHTHTTDAWILVHNTEGILIKRIIAHDVEKATIIIHSLNPDYQDEVLSLNDIAQIFAVQKYIVNAK